MGPVARWRQLPVEDRRYISAGSLAVAGVVVWALAIRRMRALPSSDLGDPDCDEAVYQAVLQEHGLTAEQAHRAWYYAPAIIAAARHWGVSADLLMGIAHTESRFNPQAGSSAGAQGLMQIMPSTGRLFYDQLVTLGAWPFGELDLSDPRQSAWIAGKYIRDALRSRGSLEGALAAYNCGPVRCPKGSGFDSWPSETRGYVRSVPKRAKYYKEIWSRCGELVA